MPVLARFPETGFLRSMDMHMATDRICIRPRELTNPPGAQRSPSLASNSTFAYAPSLFRFSFGEPSGPYIYIICIYIYKQQTLNPTTKSPTPLSLKDHVVTYVADSRISYLKPQEMRVSMNRSPYRRPQ